VRVTIKDSSPAIVLTCQYDTICLHKQFLMVQYARLLPGM